MEMMKQNLLIACAALMCMFSHPVVAQQQPAGAPQQQPAGAASQLPTSNTDISPLLIGEQVPDVTLVGTDGKEHSLVSITKEKPTIIFFYRGKWCSNCIRHFSQEIAPHAAEIAALGYNIMNVAPDVPDSLIKTAQLTNLDPATFYSDGEGALSKAMGVAVQQQERMLATLTAYSGGKNKGYLPVPAVYILDINQKVLFMYINPMSPSDKLRIRGNFLMAVLGALK
ncbi:AhpC/TSA family protein [bacterium]|nr:AhpC/TSA family protein [bacterium]